MKHILPVKIVDMKGVTNADNLFRGPLPFYTLGDPNGMALITAYGQDNAGFPR